MFTFREGLLSPIAHDLRLRLERFEIAHDDETVEGRFWPDSLVVEGAIQHIYDHGSEHSDGILTNDWRNANHFVEAINSNTLIAIANYTVQRDV